MNLTQSERQQLLTMQRSQTMAVGLVRRAKLILLIDQGMPRAAIKTKLGCDSRFISIWQKRFVSERLAGLQGKYQGRIPRPDLAEIEAKVMEYTLGHKPADGSKFWTSRKLAAELGLPFMRVQRTWRKHNIRPERVVPVKPAPASDFDGFMAPAASEMEKNFTFDTAER